MTPIIKLVSGDSNLTTNWRNWRKPQFIYHPSKCARLHQPQIQVTDWPSSKSKWSKFYSRNQV